MDWSRKKLKMADTFSIVSISASSRPPLISLDVTRSGGVKNGRKYFGRLSKWSWIPLSILVELFKNLNDGAGRSKYLHYVQGNETKIYFHQIFTISMETILSYNILKYIYIFFVTLENQNHLINLYEWLNAIDLNSILYHNYITNLIK